MTHSLSASFVFIKIPQSVGTGRAPVVGLLLMYDGLRLLSNENASRIKPSSDEEGGTPQA